MPRNALSAYQDIEKATLSGRELEASVLMRAALALAAVKENWDVTNRDEQLDTALRNNQRIWTLFQSELVEPGNPLPVEIRRNILSLSIFVDRRTFEIMAKPAPEKLDILIAINRNIAAGLRGSPTVVGQAAA
ncbi:MAG: flagellar biosynthesis regulator FlaF [Betaproteobacteria bacterium]|nr:flagellar biosynthesis regulator FlaF [Betaproteobacteria bacterium]